MDESTTEGQPQKEVDVSQLEVLIAEDNPSQRAANRLLVERLGLKGKVYAVANARFAREKYEELSEQKRRPNVLITDVNMPGDNGLVLAEELLKKDPDLQVIFVTSESEEFLREKMNPDSQFLYAGKRELDRNPLLLQQKVREATIKMQAKQKPNEI